jgi:hypothetical protein
LVEFEWQSAQLRLKILTVSGEKSEEASKLIWGAMGGFVRSGLINWMAAAMTTKAVEA